jgi:hypothetical protein
MKFKKSHVISSAHILHNLTQLLAILATHCYNNELIAILYTLHDRHLGPPILLKLSQCALLQYLPQCVDSDGSINVIHLELSFQLHENNYPHLQKCRQAFGMQSSLNPVILLDTELTFWLKSKLVGDRGLQTFIRERYVHLNMSVTEWQNAIEKISHNYNHIFYG